MWERSFVAVSILVGSSPSLDEAIASLPPGAETRLGDLGTKLRDTRRAVRAQGLAVVAQEIVVAVSEVTLR